MGLKVSVRVILPNFVAIGRTFAEL